MTDLSYVKARLHRLPLSTLIAITWRLKLARFFLWLARVTDRYEGVVMRTARRIVESAERCARKSKVLQSRRRIDGVADREGSAESGKSRAKL